MRDKLSEHRRAPRQRDGRVRRLLRTAGQGQLFDLAGLEPGRHQFGAQRVGVSMPVRRARHELRRSLGQQPPRGAKHDIGKHVFLDPVPDVEQEPAAWPQHPARLGIALDPVGKEHDPELAAHRVKAGIGQWQIQRIGHLPFDPRLAALLPFRLLQHRRVQVSDHEPGVGRQQRCEHAGHRAAARRGFQNVAHRGRHHPPGEVRGIGCEQHRHHVLVVDFRNCPGEGLVIRAHVQTSTAPNSATLADSRAPRSVHRGNQRLAFPIRHAKVAAGVLT